MTNAETKKLCLDLMNADTEEEVIQILKEAGYWDDPDVWRLYGDKEGNYASAGNQSEFSDFAFVEKLINSIDATLIGECYRHGIQPKSPEAPKSIHEAVAHFYEDSFSNEEGAGRIAGWTRAMRREAAKNITVAATGRLGRQNAVLSLSVADQGEGQSPDRFPDTFLSLDQGNKASIRFVQGLWNMGGTGALRFCGEHNLQLILSCRDPAASSPQNPHGEWGFTIVRRVDPDDEKFERRSQYKYLAPHPVKGHQKRGVLRFKSESMPIFPTRNQPYVRHAKWGSLIKLYEYETTGYAKSNVLRGAGLFARLDLLLAEPALPLQVHECRDQGGDTHAGSYHTPLTGLATRLVKKRSGSDEEAGDEEAAGDSNLSPNLEFAPICIPFRSAGQDLTITIYPFKAGKAKTYASREGVIFTVNGQTHGHLPREIFNRKRVRKNILKDSLLVMVDCSKITGRSREDLFMNSRDRLSGKTIRQSIESALEELIRDDPQLRALQAERREQEIQSKLVDQKPFEDLLRGILKNSPSLSQWLPKGHRITKPFDTRTGGKTTESKFKGRRFPEYFHFKDQKPGDKLARACAINRRARIQFDTDAEDHYFGRRREPGRFDLYLIVEGVRKNVTDYTGPRLETGVATVMVGLPPNCEVGDTLEYLAIVDDPSRVDPIENHFSIKVMKAEIKHRRPSPLPKEKQEKDPKEDSDRPNDGGFGLPPTRTVYRDEYNNFTPPFDEHTALRIRDPGQGEKPQWEFFVNGDNIFLKTEQKGRSTHPTVLENQFVLGMVLLGMGILSEEEKHPGEGGQIDERIEWFTRAVSPMLLPVIQGLGSLESTDEED